MKFKKGFLFSLFVVTALSLVIFTFRTKVEFSEERRADIYKERVEQTNIFIEDMEQDIERSLYVASFRAFLGADEYIHFTEDYIEDINKSILSLIINGTIEGKQMNSTNASTFEEWIGRMRKLGKKFNINVTFDHITIEARHISPWIINVSFKSVVLVDDFEEIQGWNFSLNEHTTIDISKANFPDPVYYIGSIRNNVKDRPLFNNIKRTSYESFWSNDSNPDPPPDEIINVTYLKDHTKRQLYRAYEKAPSYLMRLEGNFSCDNEGAIADECKYYGIESFVNVLNENIDIWDYSDLQDPTCAVDYQFFSEGCDNSCELLGEMHRIENMGGRFYLDYCHVIYYNLTEINST